MSKSLTVVDLFSGAGGLSLGFKNAGWEVVFSVDNQERFVETYGANIGNHIVQHEISENTKLPNATALIGGPPCQGFSSAGLRKNGDKRNSLVRIYANLIAEHRPHLFLFENVEGFLTAENGNYVFDLLEPLIEAGYHIHLRKVNAANYAVPQHRKRVIAIGGLGWTLSFPPPTHNAFGAPGASSSYINLPSTPTLAETIFDLPQATNSPTKNPTDHYTKPLKQDDIERIVLLKQGQTMRDLPERLWHTSYKKRANRRVMDGTPTEKRGGAPAGMRRLKEDEPSKAITSGARTEFIHPRENRFLTLRECARLQTFPDDFVFRGSLAERAIQIGNAVPPRLGEVFANSIRSDIEKNLDQDKDFRGRLVSFVPTVSNGTSPVLTSLISRIESRFDTPMGINLTTKLPFPV
ncbi:hypothetical protein A2963_04930 [Candidatus Roizmanbacteria bacterium RIFCSPLOWO2_01_FULL_40_13]|nr:MAG: hypothetical protein A2963_04930 [Candidatus Roizmanbacteria bacterium RIFCSPLOWO2_01_FULL_40_13]